MIAVRSLSIVPDAGFVAGIRIGVGMRNDRNVIIVIRHETGTDATETEVYGTTVIVITITTENGLDAGLVAGIGIG